MSDKTQRTKVLAVRVEPERDETTAPAEETHFRIKFLVDLLGQAHVEALDQRKPLDTPIRGLARSLRSRLRSYTAGDHVAVVIEALDEGYPVDRFYDDLLIGLAQSEFDRLEKLHVCCVTLLVSRPDVMLKRIMGLDFIAERLQRNDTALFVVVAADNPDGDTTTIPRKLLLRTASDRHPSPPTGVVKQPALSHPDRGGSALAEGAIELLDLEFDHFVLPSDRGPLHVPLLVSCARLAESGEYIELLKEELTSFAGTPDWHVAVSEFEGAGVEDLLVRQLVDGDATRIVTPSTSITNAHVVLLTEIAYAPTLLRSAVNDLEHRGAAWAGVMALVGTDDDGVDDVAIRSLLTLPVRSQLGSCELCDLNVPAISGGGIDDVRASLAEYEPAVFWKLVDLLPSFTEVGHWPSPRTPNHYWLRILMQDVLRSFGTSMAQRIVHALEREARLRFRWIDCIVAADDLESRLLAEKLQAIYRERPPHVVPVDRQMLRAVSPRELTDEAEEWVANAASTIGRRANVIIVDQAAHHLRTYTALKALCDRVGWHTLAFCVVVDRTLIDPELLHDVHYVSLYRWPFPPRLGTDCTCALTGAA